MHFVLQVNQNLSFKLFFSCITDRRGENNNTSLSFKLILSCYYNVIDLQ